MSFFKKSTVLLFFSIVLVIYNAYKLINRYDKFDFQDNVIHFLAIGFGILYIVMYMIASRKEK